VQPLRLRAIVALYDDKIADQMPVSDLLVGLIFGRVITRERRGIIGEFNDDLPRTGRSFRNLKLLGAD
jgi:hypothetical protein